MAKATKNTQKLFLFIKILLAIVVGFLCFLQFKKIDFSEVFTLEVSAVYSLIFMILLMPLNYFFEWLKWKAILKTVDTNFGNRIHFQSFMAGVITGMLTPNMQGNFLGRMYYYPRKYRSTIILMTLWSNLGQFIIALLFGAIALSVIGTSNYLKLDSSILWLLIGMIGMLFCVFLTIDYWRIGKKRMRFFQRFKVALHQHQVIKFEILLWGSLRYIVFSFQFLLMLHAFGGEFSWEMFLLVWQLYFWSTIAPALILGKLFVRESIALWVFAGFEMGELNIIVASLLIWVVNLLIPTLIGIFVCQKSTLE